MKGPRNRTVLDVRRVWKCGQCSQERRLDGDVTSVQCPCQSPPVWMTIVAERTGRLPPSQVTLPARIPFPEWRPQAGGGNDFPAPRGERPNKRPPRPRDPAPGDSSPTKTMEQGGPPQERPRNPLSVAPSETNLPTDNDGFAEGLGLAGDNTNPSAE
jgi:hypothetical protein